MTVPRGHHGSITHSGSCWRQHLQHQALRALPASARPPPGASLLPSCCPAATTMTQMLPGAMLHAKQTSSRAPAQQPGQARVCCPAGWSSALCERDSCSSSTWERHQGSGCSYWWAALMPMTCSSQGRLLVAAAVGVCCLCCGRRWSRAQGGCVCRKAPATSPACSQ